jgi:hypothetical protein
VRHHLPPNRPSSSSASRIEDTHRFSIFNVCHVLLHPIALAGSGFAIKALLPPNFGADQTITISTALGPVHAEFQQIATIP